MRAVSIFQRVMLVFFVAQFIMTGVLIDKASHQPDHYQTTVYHTDRAIPGPLGPTGATGAEGLSVVGPPGATTYNQVPITVLGQPAAPCTVSQDENGDTIIACPDGSSVTIPKATDGTNGVDGRDVEIYKNPSTGNIDRKYTGDSDAEVLIRKCEYQGNCDGS